MVPHRLPKHTSTLPSRSEVPFTKRTSPSVQLAVRFTGGLTAVMKISLLCRFYHNICTITLQFHNYSPSNRQVSTKRLDHRRSHLGKPLQHLPSVHMWKDPDHCDHNPTEILQSHCSVHTPRKLVQLLGHLYFEKFYLYTQKNCETCKTVITWHFMWVIYILKLCSI